MKTTTAFEVISNLAPNGRPWTVLLREHHLVVRIETPEDPDRNTEDFEYSYEELGVDGASVEEINAEIAQAIYHNVATILDRRQIDRERQEQVAFEHSDTK